jgi:aminocarboxymuconate-semialdehyde decarboxylase
LSRRTPEVLALCFGVGAADHVMYGSDDPHNIGDMKGCLARVDGPPPDQREKVRGQNAQRIRRSPSSSALPYGERVAQA